MTFTPTTILFVMMGNVGSGKSYTASRIGDMLRETFPRRRTVIVRSDEVRAALCPGDFSWYANKAVFEEAHSRIDDALRTGCLAIADATNLIMENREQFHLIAHAAGAIPRTVYCAAPEDVIARRLARKLSGFAESFGSTADMEIHRRMAPNDIPPPEPHFMVTPNTLDSSITEMRAWALSLLGNDAE